MTLVTNGSLPASLISAAFPFHLAFDHRCYLTQVGPSIAKVSDRFVVGEQLSALCDFVDHERYSQQASSRKSVYDLIELASASETDRAVVLEVKGCTLRLRGLIFDGGDEFYFLGTPWCDGIEDLLQLGLEAADFAPHDTTFERLRHQATLQSQLATASAEVQRARRADSHYAERLDYESSHDSVTGLANREGVRRAIDVELAAGKQLALVFIDLDDFKRLNDAYGHEVGDNILRQIAIKLGRAIRWTDTVGRLGGDEFALVLRGVSNADDARGASDRVLRVACQDIEIDGNRVQVRASVGIALSAPNDTAIKMFRNADIAMYHAKAIGQGGASVYTQEMSDALAEQVKIQRELEVGIPREEIVPRYQPIISLHDQRTIGVEALARWQHPDRGQLSPAVFIDVAERTGLIVELGQRLLGRACAEVHKANTSRQHPWTVNVNLSPLQVQHPDIVAMVAETLTTTGIPAQHLKLEITETTLFADVDQAESVFHQLKELGVKVMLDDFGTGYSSMQYLRRFPIDGLKIDRTFVDQIDQTKSSLRLVDSTIKFGLSMGLDVVAEGIERPRQLELLRSMGCPLGQGFLFSKPTELPQLL